MIIDSIKNKHLYQSCGDLKDILNFLATNADTPFQVDNGKVILVKDKIHYMYMEATTIESEADVQWEAHHKYIDFHYVIEGNIKVHLNYAENMKPIDDYNEAWDVTHYSGEKLHEVILKAGMFAMLPTGLVHRSLLSVHAPEPIKILIFKIKVS